MSATEADPQLQDTAMVEVEPAEAGTADKMDTEPAAAEHLLLNSDRKSVKAARPLY
jgi:hypothetical protein